MRKMGMALMALVLAGGAAGAVEETARQDDATVQTYRLNRWAFDGAGPNESQMAYRDCPAGKLVTVNSRRNAGDWTLLVLSAGWYTPAHTTVRCAR